MANTILNTAGNLQLAPVSPKGAQAAGLNPDASKMMLIYCITNTVNGKRYIGMTTRGAKRRKNDHWRRANCRHKPTSILYSAMDKYGQSKFTFTIIEYATSFDELCELEKHYIAHYNTLSPCGYNIESGGSTREYVADRTKKLLSDKLKGRVFSEETKRMMSESAKLRIQEGRGSNSLGGIMCGVARTKWFIGINYTTGESLVVSSKSLKNLGLDYRGVWAARTKSRQTTYKGYEWRLYDDFMGAVNG